MYARRRFGSGDLAGRTVVVQGVGSVGSALSERLHEAGATLVVSDVDGDRSSAIARRLGSLGGWSARRLDAELEAYQAHVARSQRFRA